MLRGRRFFEADNGTTVPQVVESTPPAIVHVATEVPSLAHSGGETALELPHAAIHETLKGLTTATEALTLAANKLADTATKSVETVQPVIEEPLQGASVKAEEISPEIVPPVKERFVRRNGRKVKR